MSCRHGDTGPFAREDVRFTVEATVPNATSDSVVLRIKAFNRSRYTRAVEYNHCGMLIGFATGRGKSTRVWNGAEWQRSRGETPGGPCLAYSATGVLQPHDSADTYRVAVPIRAVLGDSLPPGLYRAILGGNARLEGGLVSREIDLR